VGSIARWQVTADNIGTFPELVQTLYKKAICAQVDFFAVNGLDSVAGGTDRGFTVGKVSINGKSGSELVRKGSMADYLSPQVMMYLEQTGLIGPQVATVHDMPFMGVYW
jgi:hypothetical protein